jgi:UPF0716 family protein affecting phage T7 exclusion
MAKLPAWSWLTVGLLIAITSWYVEIPLFFWLGWLFILVGAAKFLIGYLLSKKETQEEKSAVQQAAHQPRYPPVRHASHQYYRCSCGNPVKASDNFCGYCGRRLR